MFWGPKANLYFEEDWYPLVSFSCTYGMICSHLLLLLLLLLLLFLFLLQLKPVKVNYNYFTLYKASSLNLKII